jgi:hypothetical protein
LAYFEGKRILRTQLEPEDIQAIALAVMEQLKPIVIGNGKHDPDDKWFNVTQLSEYVSMSPQWIYNNKSKLPHVNMNSKPLFKKSEIDLWLESFRVNTGNEVITFPVNAGKQNRGIQSSGFSNQKRKAVTSL